MTAFKAYDIRGIYPKEINEQLAFLVGKAVATYLDAKELVLSRDMRISSKSLHEAVVKGIIATGTNIIDIGLSSTPQFYFELYSQAREGGIMITASHNPKEYNGFKICGPQAKPIYKENGFKEIQEIIRTEKFKTSSQKGTIFKKEIQSEYANFLKSFVRTSTKKLKVLFDTGNGMGVREVKVLQKIFGDQLDANILFEELNGNFPNHECNPIIEKEYHELSRQLKEGQYDLGVAFDGDADRVAFFTKDGRLVSPDTMIPIIASEFAKQGDAVGFDLTCSRLVQEELEAKGFTPEMYKVGRSFIGTGMKKTGAVFAGEKSGHCFFKKLYYTDSSSLAVIGLFNILCSQEKSFEEILSPLRGRYVNTGNIHFSVRDKDGAIAAVKDAFAQKADKVVELDGVSIYTKTYFFNLRKSNTEPIIKLTLEGRDKSIVQEIQAEIKSILQAFVDLA